MTRPLPDLDVAGLSGSDAERLAALVSDAMDRQSSALDDAIRDGLRHVPKLLRGPLKAVLFR